MIRCPTALYFRLILTLVVLAGICGPLRADTYTVNSTGNVQAAIDILQPGDTLYLEPGVYTGNLKIQFKNTFHGAPYNTYEREHDDPAMWITITALDPDNPPILQSASSLSNCLDLYNQSSYIKLTHLEITASSEAIKGDNTGIHHIVIENCYVHDIYHTAIGFQNGISYLTVRNTEVCRSGVLSSNGELMYLGHHDGAAPMTDSLIEYNHIHDTISTNAQDGDGIEIKRGGARNIIRHNIIYNTYYPGIFSYGNTSTDHADANVIYGNVIWGCATEAVQICGNTAFYNNIVFNSMYNLMLNTYSGSAAYYQNIKVYNNLFYSSSLGTGGFLIENGFEDTASHAFYNNACYDTVAPGLPPGGAATISNNISGNLSAAAADMLSPSITPGSCDFYPQAGGAWVDAGAAGAPADDFNGSLRDGSPDIGAYEYITAANPGWQISTDFKEGPALTLQIDSPAADAQISGTEVITGQAISTTGTAVSEVQIRINGGSWTAAAGTDTWSYDLDTTAYADGYTLIEAQATDGTEFSLIQIISVIINNAGGALIQTVFTDIEDTYVFSSEPDNANGGTLDRIYSYDLGNQGFPLVKINSLGNVKAGSTILYARLYYCEQDHNGSPTTCTALRMLTDWDFTTATWNTFTFPDDYAVLPECTRDYSSISGGWLNWDITAAAQHIVDGDPNYGIILVPASGWDVNLHSVETSFASLTPYLEIAYLENPADITSPPDPVLDNLNDGDTISGVVIITGTATDNTGVQEVTIQINGETPVIAILDNPGGTSTGFSGTIDTSAFDGAGTITIIVSDGTNTTVNIFNVTFDNPATGGGGSSSSRRGCRPDAAAGSGPILALVLLAIMAGRRRRSARVN
ncbi:DNRLRE domain-containing protein [Planctomycetota bacterium]